ncbi:MAG: homoserine dehydrogenase [Tissierellia bacterium]|nr:homoserine dehydrogenase [Tissierellia bacterium]
MIGLLGFGTVGKGVYEILKGLDDKPAGCEIKSILVSSLDKHKDYDLNFTTDVERIIQDKEINIVVECTGSDDAYGWLVDSMKSGKSVITANKAVVSKHFEELSRLAEENSVDFLYEASVAGGIPVIKSLSELILYNEIEYIGGVLNGTSNFVLTSMPAKTYEEAVKEAQSIGFAEADPSADVDGIDAMRKLRILATLAFGYKVEEEEIFTKSISSVDSIDISYMEERNMKVKQLALAVKGDGDYQALVVPFAIPKESPLASLEGGENCVFLEGSNVGPLKFIGLGAGMYPTGNAVVSNIYDVLFGKQFARNPLANQVQAKATSPKGKFYLRTVNGLPKEIKGVAKEIKTGVYETDFIDFSLLKDFKGTVICMEVEK